VLFRTLLAVSFVVALPSMLQAQYGNRTRGQWQPGAMQQPVQFHGRILGVDRKGLVVATPDLPKVTVALMPVTKMSVTGSTTAAALRSTNLRPLVEFNAEIDDRGAIKGTIDELTVVSEQETGFFPAADTKAQGVGEAFGVGADKKDKDTNSEKAESTKPTGAKRTKRPTRTSGKGAAHPQAGNYRIVGRLVVGRGGALSVQPGRSMMPFELSEDAKVEIDMTDLSLASRGNEVVVRGYPVPNRVGLVQAAEIRVKLPEADGAARARPGPKRRPAEQADKAGEKEPSPKARDE
jgi:hypothetical protein